MKQQLLLIACTALLCTNSVFADVDRPDAHAPIGVMGDHTHKKGELMTSVRWMRMSMENLISGSDSLSDSQAMAAGFMMSPEEMTLDMTLLSAMYGVTEKTTLMVMLPYRYNEMTMKVLSTGDIRKMTASGLGDVSITSLYTVYKETDSNLHLNLGLSLPTGGIDEKDGAALNLPYPMQLGAGSYGLIYGYTYNKNFKGWSFGNQFKSKAYLGKNDNNYKLGNEYEFTEWVSRKWSEFVSTSLRLTYFQRGNITGADSDVITRESMVSTPLNTTQTGREYWTVGIGVNFVGRTGFVKNQRLAFEYVAPISQRTASTQLEVENTVTFAWQKVF